MFFTKYPYSANFAFADAFDPDQGEMRIGGERFELSVLAFEGGVHRIALSQRKRWRPTRRIVELTPGAPATSAIASTGDGFAVRDEKGKVLLATVPGAGIGVSGAASMFQFAVGKDARFFGMGEKTFGRLELSGRRAKFWNTDVWGDFHFAQWLDHPTDPPYASVPYLIVRTGGAYVGLLLDNPYPTFMETPGRPGGPEVFVEWQRTSPHLILGSEGGEPTLWAIVGPTLPELTRKLQKLVGTTPLPPLWALGYHQSRWGYAGEKDLVDLDRRFTEHRIPCDGLWLDIDYMRGYRVFTVDSKAFPKGIAHAAKKVGGRRIVAILDPGVKNEPGWDVFDDGFRKGVYCANAEGKPFVGLVWPGETVFPDFSLAKGRDWWKGKVREFVRQGFGGFWIDMNDPSTGPVDPTGMRFDAGREPHEAQHNQYALGMQRASFEALRSAFPSRRPFLLSRSAFIGTSRYSAVWTGDNLSNRFYLRMSIPTSVGLALSGIPFNGADIGGFGGDTDEALMIDWMKAGFLFPLFRNHTSKGTRDQEPWAFSKGALSVIRRFIRLRYRLLPYLYQLFVRQEEVGEAILRPLFYDFSESGLDEVDDQFLVGPSLMQAPFLNAEAKQRDVRLPGGAPWFNASAGVWRKPGTLRARRAAGETPLFIRDGAIVPMRAGDPAATRTDLRRVEIHFFLSPEWKGRAELDYVADDGETLAYRKGKRSRLHVRVEGREIRLEQTESGFGRIRPTVIVHGPRREWRVNGRKAASEPVSVRLSGKPFRAWRVKL